MYPHSSRTIKKEGTHRIALCLVSMCLKAGHRFTKLKGILPYLLPERKEVCHCG
jgi:hypothetical protein